MAKQPTLEQLTKNIGRMSELETKRKYIASVLEQHPGLGQEVIKGCLEEYVRCAGQEAEGIYDWKIRSEEGCSPPTSVSDEGHREIEQVHIDTASFLEEMGMRYDNEYALRQAFRQFSGTGHSTSMRRIAEKLGDQELLKSLKSEPKRGVIQQYYQEESDREFDQMNLGANLAAFMQREAEAKRNYPSLIKEAARLEREGQYQDAARAYEKASHTEDHTKNNLKAGINYHRAGDARKAREHLLSAGNKEALEFCLAEGLEKIGLKIAEDDGALLEKVGDYYESVGRGKDAKKLYARAADLMAGRNQWSSKEHVAMLYEKAGHPDHAATWYFSGARECVYSGELSEKGRHLAQRSVELSLQVKDYSTAARAYELMGDFEKSFEMRDKAEKRK